MVLVYALAKLVAEKQKEKQIAAVTIGTCDFIRIPKEK